MSDRNRDEFRSIYEIEITKENVPAMLSHEIISLMTRYGSRIRESIDSIILPPSAFLAFREWGAEHSRSYSTPRGYEMSFEGIKVTCGYVPFVQFAFKPDGWNFAHMEAKRFTDKNAEPDA